MNGIRIFRREEKGSVSLDVIEVAAGSITIGIMAVYAILSGSPTVPAGHAEGRAAWETNTAHLDADEALALNARVLLPVGSVAVHSESGLTVFETPGGGWVDAWTQDGPSVPVGTVLASTNTFQLPDGRSLEASAFAASISEAYGSEVKFAFN